MVHQNTNSARALRPVSTVMADAVYALLFEKASDAILSVWCNSLTVHSANPRIEDLTGYTVADLVGHSAQPLFPTSGSDMDGKLLNADVLALAGLHEDVCLRCADDHNVFVSIAIGHVATDLGPLAICILRDTTMRRLLERELITKHMALRQAHEELSVATQNLEVRNRELQVLSSQIAELSKHAAIGEFTAGTAHSINNPLAAVLSACRQIEKITESLDPTETTQRLKTLLKRQKDAATRIQTVVDDLRRVHKHGALHKEAQQVDIPVTIDQCLTMLDHRIKNNVRVVRHTEPVKQIFGYIDELQHLFTNLLDNALLAMKENGSIRIECTRLLPQGVMVAIEDSGPGIPENMRSRIFEPFVTSRPGGTGLGLSAAMRITQQHRGRVYAGSGNLGGAKFVVELPGLEPFAPPAKLATEVGL